MSRQRLGQHFLVKGKTLERIARAACGERTGLVVEIGSGRGALTERLLAHADRVIAIEIDTTLVAYLRGRRAAWLPSRGPDEAAHAARENSLELVEANALDIDWSQWGAGVLTGNLPYYAATPIIEKYVRAPGALTQAVFLIQKEVAERVTAKTGREYGYFSVLCQFFAETEYLFTVPPGAFQPPPKVDSAVVRLTPRKELAVKDADGFLSMVSACFRQKRKTLRNNLPEAPPELASKRAEQLSAAEFIRLYEAVRSSRATL